jgi:alkylation response protein AidB-like acyl-CoA dehydrogenase
MAIALSNLEGGRIGIAHAAFEAAVEYCKTRKQFNQPIAELDSIGARQHLVIARALTWAR